MPPPLQLVVFDGCGHVPQEECPTPSLLLLMASHQPTHPFDCSHVPPLQLVVFDACGHMPHEECPDQFVETVQRFVASLDRPAEGQQPQAAAQGNGA